MYVVVVGTQPFFAFLTIFFLLQSLYNEVDASFWKRVLWRLTEYYQGNKKRLTHNCSLLDNEHDLLDKNTYLIIIPVKICNNIRKITYDFSLQQNLDFQIFNKLP